MFKKITFASICLILISPLSALADTRWDEEVVDLIDRAHAHSRTVEGRIDYLTAEFVAAGYPYIAEPLGEGSDALYNQKPLYRLDAFDCTTFIETILALATTQANKNDSITLKNFQNKINAIRYKDADISFYNRNHFPSGDWLPEQYSCRTC